VRVAALVLAAGSSQRFGGRPKQFEDLGGATVLQRAVRAFEGVPGIDEIWVVTALEHADRTRSMLAPDGITGIVIGGETRAESTSRGLDALSPDVTHVLIHDAARPLVPGAIVRACREALWDADVVATVVEPDDSVVVLDGGRVLDTPDRRNVRMYQTPQGFRRALLATAWERLASGDAPTDDVTAVLRAFPDVSVAWIQGHRRAAKITQPDDLVALRAMLSGGE